MSHINDKYKYSLHEKNVEIRTLRSQRDDYQVQLERTQKQLAVNTADLTSSLDWRDRHLEMLKEKDKLITELKSEVRTLGASLESAELFLAQQENVRINGEYII